MLLDSLDKSILITRGRKASIPTYFLYEELSHREKQPSSIKKIQNKYEIQQNKLKLHKLHVLLCHPATEKM